MIRVIPVFSLLGSVFFTPNASANDGGLFSGSMCENQAAAASMSAMLRLAPILAGSKPEPIDHSILIALAEKFQDDIGVDQRTSLILAAFPAGAQLHKNILSDVFTHKHLFFNMCHHEIPLMLVKDTDLRGAASCYDAAKKEDRDVKPDDCIVELFSS